MIENKFESIQLEVLRERSSLIDNNDICNGIVESNRKYSVKLTHLVDHRSNVNIVFKNISYSASCNSSHKGSKKQQILKCISGEFKSAELNGILGPSGSGKSTLMNILAGYKTSNLKGSILINGQARNLRRFRKLSCYIMQNDELLPLLTVKEALFVSANLKLGNKYSLVEKQKIINEIIDALSLSNSTNTMTVNLSGGQKKRLSIALELVNNPPVMFFDEPTSGLDSSSCFQLISLLKSLARGGRTIICTIHQPSARLFEMFDHLYMLADGQCIYEGIVMDVVPFLTKNGYMCPSFHNPADFIMEVVCGEHGDSIPKLVKSVEEKMRKRSSNVFTMESVNRLETGENESFTVHINDDSSSALKKCCMSGKGKLTHQYENKITFAAPFCTQFWILLMRCFKTTIRDQTLTHMRLIAHFVVGAIIGMIYYDIGNDAAKVISNAGCIFFIVMFTMFTAMMPTILTFPTEMNVFTREYLNYWYSLKAYYFAKTVADLPFQITFTTIYVIVIYYLTNQPWTADRLGMFVLICILTSLVAQSIGLLIGSGLSVEIGTFIGPISTIPTVLFSGFFVNLEVIPSYLKWLPYASYVKYAFEGAMISIYGMNRDNMDCEKIYCHFRKPSRFLKEFSMVEENFWINVAVLIVMFIAFRITAYFVLRYKLHSMK